MLDFLLFTLWGHFLGRNKIIPINNFIRKIIDSYAYLFVLILIVYFILIMLFVIFFEPLLQKGWETYLLYNIIATIIGFKFSTYNKNNESKNVKIYEVTFFWILSALLIFAGVGTYLDRTKEKIESISKDQINKIELDKVKFEREYDKYYGRGQALYKLMFGEEAEWEAVKFKEMEKEYERIFPSNK